TEAEAQTRRAHNLSNFSARVETSNRAGGKLLSFVCPGTGRQIQVDYAVRLGASQEQCLELWCESGLGGFARSRPQLPRDFLNGVSGQSRDDGSGDCHEKRAGITGKPTAVWNLNGRHRLRNRRFHSWPGERKIIPVSNDR